MPWSDGQGKDWAVEQYQRLRPATVLDLGAGAGTYAKLMRPHHRGHWTALEAWAPYVAEYGLTDLYDEVIVADARWVDRDRAFDRDLVIAGDVLEHMARPEATALIRGIQARAAHLLVSVPVLHLDQDDVGGNTFERHVDHWTFDDMRAVLGAGVTATWCGDVLAYFLWRR